MDEVAFGSYLEGHNILYSPHSKYKVPGFLWRVLLSGESLTNTEEMKELELLLRLTLHKNDTHSRTPGLPSPQGCPTPKAKER